MASFPSTPWSTACLHLTDELSELRPLRHIRVLKLRGSAPVRGLHSVRITDNGLEVRPRIETLFPQGAVGEERVATGAKLAFGVQRARRHAARRRATGLDHHAAGLVGQREDPARHAIPVARASSEANAVVYFGFYEHPEAILAKCQRVGIGGLKEGVERGHGARSSGIGRSKGVIDELGESLIETVRKVGAQRAVHRRHGRL